MRWLEAWTFALRKKRDWTKYVVKTKALISCVVMATSGKGYILKRRQGKEASNPKCWTNCLGSISQSFVHGGRGNTFRCKLIFYVFLSCVCYAFVRVCLYVPCGYLLGKGWPLGSRLWCLTVSLLKYIQMQTYLLCFSVLCLLCLCTRLFVCALWLPTGKGLTSWLSFVVSYCEFVTFPLVSWVRCGTWLYPFLNLHPYLLCNWIGSIHVYNC